MGHVGNEIIELYTDHCLLHQFEMPSWVGRLPSDVGYPAAGSLSADEYKALALVYLPIIVCLTFNLIADS